MNPQDLRKGNIVSRGFFNPNPKNPRKEYGTCKVVSLGLENLLTTETLTRNKYIKTHYDNLKPIPLTEEWLLKFGFEETYRSDYTVKFELPYNPSVQYVFSLLSGEQLFRWCDYGFPCKYAHDLQNKIFALTGEELTIKE